MCGYSCPTEGMSTIEGLGLAASAPATQYYSIFPAGVKGFLMAPR